MHSCRKPTPSMMDGPFCFRVARIDFRVARIDFRVARIDFRVARIDSRQARKMLTEMTKQMATDKCILGFLLLIVGGIVTVIVLKAGRRTPPF